MARSPGAVLEAELPVGLAVTGDVGGGIWKVEEAQEGRPLPRQLRGLSAGAGGGEAVAVSVGSADSVDTSGDETVVAEVLACLHAGFGQETARERHETAGTSCREYPGGGGNRPSIPATARMLAAAVTPYHQRW